MRDARASIFREIRAACMASRGRGLTTDEVRKLDQVLDGMGIPRTIEEGTEEPTRSVRWVVTARSMLGLAEIPGARHESRILAMWKRLKVSWFNDDETPWCGAFIGYCMAECGIEVPPPGEVGRAASWAVWGVPCLAQVGAVGVKKRPGGNHVFLIVGETPDKRFYKALGGNQSNRVSIMDIAKADTFAIRWPEGVRQLHLALPVMPPGTVSTNEA